MNSFKVFVDKAQQIIDETMRLEAEEQRFKERWAKMEKKQRDFVQELEDMGLSSLSLTDGTTLNIKDKIHCEINKNLADKSNVAEWLKEKGEEELVDECYIVIAPSQKVHDALVTEKANFYQSIDINTNKVKAWLKEGLGYGKSKQVTIEMEDLPKGLHFFVEKELKVD